MSDDPRIERIETKIDRLNEKMEGISQRILVMETEEQMNENLKQTRRHTIMQWFAIGLTMSIVVLDLIKVWLI